MIAVDFGKPGRAEASTSVEAEVTEHINLNSSRSDKETIHLELAFDGAAPAYEPGDSLDLYRRERSGLCRCAAQGRRAVGRRRRCAPTSSRARDVTTLSLKTLETYAAATGHQYVKALIDAGDGARLDRRPPADRSGRAFPDRARRRAAARADAAAGAARLFDRVVARAKSATRRIC